MFNVFKRIRLGFLVLAAGLLLPSVLLADANYDALKAQVEALALLHLRHRTTFNI